MVPTLNATYCTDSGWTKMAAMRRARITAVMQINTISKKFHLIMESLNEIFNYTRKIPRPVPLDISPL